MNSKQIINKTFKRFYISTAIGTLCPAIIQVANLVLAGRFFGQDGSFIIGLVLPLMIFTEIIVFLFGIGGGTAVSAALGRGEIKKANDIFTLTIVCTLVVGALAFTAGALFAFDIARVLGAADSEQVALSIGYIRAMMFGMPVVMASSVLNVLVRNDNKPVTAMLGTVCAMVLNAVMIIVTVDILGYGIEFIAVSTIIAHISAVLIYIMHFSSKHSSLGMVKNPDKSAFISIIKPGFAGAVIFFAQMILTVVINNVLKDKIGYIGIAAYGVIKYIITFVYAVYDGINHSAQPMFGVYYGERDDESIGITAYSSIKLSIVCGVLLAVLFIAAAPFISSYFGMDINTAIYITGASCVFSCVVTFFNAYYRSTGKEKISFFLITLDNLLLPALLIYIFVYVLDFAENGVWLALMASEIITLLLIALLFGKNVLKLNNSAVPKDKVFQAIIESRETDIVALNASIEAFCDRHKVDAKKRYYIFLCIEEVAVNIIKHGFSGNEGHYIDIKLVADKDISLTIRDDAVKFDPTKKTDADITSSAEERDIGGLGIYLVKQISKEFHYKRVIGFNSLHIVL